MTIVARSLPLKIFIAGASALFILVIIKTAWLADDAFITFRTVDNFINGYGLTWNPAERVQAYTHPLWMILLSILYVITQELYYTSLIFSILIVVITLIILGGLTAYSQGVLLAIIILTLSKAFTDYSTSGLENPLTFLLLTFFLFIYLKQDISHKKLFLLTLIASLLLLTRMDTLLLVGPVLLFIIIKLRDVKAIHLGLLGLTPFLLWECFSVFYYGFPFPNTAYAKLNMEVNRLELIEQGYYYLRGSLVVDPLTLFVIIGTLVMLLITHDWPKIIAALGVILYLLYIVTIGGDFMSGRFLAVPLLASVILLTNHRLMSHNSVWALILIFVVALGLSSPYSPVYSGIDYGLFPDKDYYHIDHIETHGVIDERAAYYEDTGLLRVLKNPELLQTPYEEQIAPVSVGYTIGQDGYYGGQKVHIIDGYALADAFLARLPFVRGSIIQSGHLHRRIPDGYKETIMTGENKIKHSDLASFYDKLTIVIAGNLLSMNRLKEIWNLNIGKYNQLLANYANAPVLHITKSNIRDLQTKNLEDYRTLEIKLDQPYHSKQIIVEVFNLPQHDIREDQIWYQVIYRRQTTPITYQWIVVATLTIPPEGGVVLLDVPVEAVRNGYDNIQISPINGDNLAQTIIYNINNIIFPESDEIP